MRLLVILTAVLLSTVSFAQQSEASTVEKLARQFGEAWLNGDVQTLDRLLAREYTHTDVTGRVLHRADWLADAANVQKWARSSDSNHSPSIESYDVKVEIRGDAAIVTGGNIIHPASPEAKSLNLRFTQVWVKEDGQWKRRYFQATPVSPTKS